MSLERKHIAKLIKLENNGELKRLLGEREFQGNSFLKLEEKINIIAEELITHSIEAARDTGDMSIVDSHCLKAFEKLENSKKKINKSSLLDGFKIIGTLLIGSCLTHLIHASQQNSDIQVNLIVVSLGIIGGVLLGFGLFYKISK